MRTLIHAVEVAFESIQMSGPEPAELSQPGIHLLRWFRLQPVETALCVHCRLHETGVSQHAQVLGHGRLRHTKLTLDLSHRLLGRDQEAQYSPAVRLRNDFEYRSHSLHILHRAYACQGIYKWGQKRRCTPDSCSCRTRLACNLSGQEAVRPIHLFGLQPRSRLLLRTPP